MAIESETRVLAAILPDRGGRMEKAQLRKVSEENFSHPNLQTLWKLIDRYYDDHMAVMPLWVLKERVEKMQLSATKQATLIEAYQSLSKFEVTDHELEAAIDLLKEEELTRKTEDAIVTAREILRGDYYDEKADRAVKGQDNAREFLTGALRELESMGTEYAPEGDVRDDIEKIWNTYLEKEANPDVAGGIKCGIDEVDEFTGGVRAGELALVAGFTGSGKSHFVISQSWNALLAGKNVLMFTTETTREEMEIRILARHSRLPQFRTPRGIDSHDLLNGKLPDDHKAVFREVLNDFKARDTGNLWMVQMPSNGAADYVQAKAAQYNRIAPVDLIVIDSINLLRMGRRYDSKREMLEDLLQDFKRFASAFDGGRGVAIVSPWQMSRTAWKEAMDAGGVYSLASLSDTSEAEKSASQIITIFKDEDPSGNGTRLNIQVLKNRGGKEMHKISYPYDYRNSYIGGSGESHGPAKPQGTKAQVVQSITGLMG